MDQPPYHSMNHDMYCEHTETFSNGKMGFDCSNPGRKRWPSRTFPIAFVFIEQDETWHLIESMTASEANELNANPSATFDSIAQIKTLDGEVGRATPESECPVFQWGYENSGITPHLFPYVFETRCYPKTALEVGEECRDSDWIPWSSRNIDDSLGEFESVSDLGLPPGGCEVPTAAQAREVGTTLLQTVQNVAFDLGGLTCLNTDNQDACFDYEVRYCCPPVETLKCLQTSSDFGVVPWRSTANERYAVTNEEAMLQRTAGDINECATECWNTAGCHKSMFTNINDCFIYMGKDTAVLLLNGASPDPGVTVQEGTTGELSNVCGEPPFHNDFKLLSRFYCKFVSTSTLGVFIQYLLETNDIDSSTPLGEWIFTGVEKSQFVNIYGDDVSSTASYVLINFKLTTFTRFPISRRKRRSTSDNISAAITAADELIEKLQTLLTLPDGASVIETSATEYELVLTANNGEESGTCTTDGCTCNSGFIADEDGGCVMGQDSNQSAQVSNQSPQISNQSPQVSNQLPQVSDQLPQVSQQSSQISDQYPQVSNQTPQTSNQLPQVSDQLPQVSQQSSQVSDQYPQVSSQHEQVSNQLSQVSDQYPQLSNQ